MGPLVGSIQVVTQTNAASPEAVLDPDGYTVLVGGLPSQPIDVNGTVTLRDLLAGNHVVKLDGLQINCTTPENPVGVTVKGSVMAEVFFEVTCRPPTTGRIVFTGNLREAWELWAVDPDGTDLEALTTLYTGVLAPSHLFPAWSPDGWKIAFMHQDMSQRNIWVMNADGTGMTQLTRTGTFIRNMHPAWSPDGSRIAFASDRSGNLDIYLMDSDGTNLVQLTDNNADELVPSWSPDGSEIVFCRTGDVYVMNPDGTGQTRLTHHAAEDWPGGHSFSPDGSRILFSSDRDGNWEVYVMDRDGSNQLRLTDSKYRSEEPAAWSPDGTKILFTSQLEGANERLIYYMNSDGTGAVPVTKGIAGGVHIYPDWSHGTGSLSMHPPYP